MESEDSGAFIALGKRRKLPYQIEDDTCVLSLEFQRRTWPPVHGPMVNGPWYRIGPYRNEWL